MNLLIVTPSYFPMRGGGEQLVHDLASRYAEKHRVHIVTPLLPGAAREETIGKVRAFRFPIVRKPLLDALSGQMALAPLLKRLHAEHRYDFIQMFHLYQLGGATVRFANKNRIPLLTTLIGWDTFDPIRPVPRIFNPYLAYVMNHSDYCVTSSLHMASSARKQGCRNSLDIVPHGTSMFDQTALGINIREKYGIEPDKKIVLSVQRLAPRKGLDVLLKAIRVLKRDDVVFLICGKGSEQENLERQAHEDGLDSNVVFAGFVPDEELRDHYEQADLFALPSLYEGFGIVFVDALACGVPVVTTLCGGPEAVINETNGCLVPVGDPDRFACAVDRALDRVWDRNSIREGARIYEWKNIVNCYEKLFTIVRQRRQNEF